MRREHENIFMEHIGRENHCGIIKKMLKYMKRNQSKQATKYVEENGGIEIEKIY